MRRLTNTLIFALMAGTCFAQAKPFASWLISPGETKSAAVEVWPETSGEKQSFWRLVSSSGTILAEMKQPMVPSGYTLNYGECKVSGVLRYDTIAIVRHSSQKEWSSDLRGVWIPDENAKSFVKAQSKLVKCRNESYGV
ncbi:hypothetical protein [Rhodoferax sp.]|jgi:hypothetical protein|uniref:hypothetical protein n=1 Tax=Rhodoferax sp. TaxID=50421 RepID=UPI0037851C7B